MRLLRFALLPLTLTLSPVVMSCDDNPGARPPGATIKATAGVSAAPSERLLRDTWLVNADGTGLHRLTERLTELADSSLSLAWSADNVHVYAIGDTGFWVLNTTDAWLQLIGPPNLAGRVQTLVP